LLLKQEGALDVQRDRSAIDAAGMTGGRSARVWSLVAEQAAIRGERVSAADVCPAVVAAVEVTGAWLLAARGAEPGHLMWVTDEDSELLAELQLTLGEGPGPDAAAFGGMVLASDLSLPEAGRRWPAFAPAARQAGAAAIFAFPLQVGAIRAGVMGLYRIQAGPLSGFQLGDALLFADAATLLLLEDADQPTSGAAAGGSGPGGQTAELSRHRAEIDQATGMLTEQLGVGIAEAFIRLRAYAYAHDRRLSDLARDIVARRLRLRPDPDLRKDEQA
jgi:ANTAR domain